MSNVELTGGVDNVGCLNGTIKVAAGHYVDLQNPDPATIDLRSIAAALSKICRFGGHCPKFYSVAEHCCLMYRLAKGDRFGMPYGWIRKCLLEILLHDATEAYVGDMVRPLKVTMPQFGEAERRIERAIEKAYGLDFAAWKTTIKYYDNIMLKAEKLALWPEDTETWHGFENIRSVDVRFQFWSPVYAESEFYNTAIELIRERR